MLTLRDKSYVVTLTVYSSCVIFGMVCGAKLIPVWFAGLFGIALIFAVLSLVRWSQPALEELQAKYDSLKQRENLDGNQLPLALPLRKPPPVMESAAKGT